MSVFYWTTEELARAVNGKLIAAEDKDSEASKRETRFARVVTDSRSVAGKGSEIAAEFAGMGEYDNNLPGVLYIAVCGQRFNGHDFIAQVIAEGACALLVSEEQTDCPIDQVIVEDTRLALGRFGAWHRQQMPLKALIGVTGSNGKTTVKTLLKSFLETQGNTLATQGNLNNDFGVPRTLLELRPEHDFAIIEMGANHQGEIAYLTHLAQPDIAVLNNAAGAHLEGFGSLQGVIDAKGEIFQGIKAESPYGIAVLNEDSPGYQQWLTSLKHLAVKECVSFAELKTSEQSFESRQQAGHGCSKRVSWKNLRNTDRGIAFSLLLQSSQQSLELPVNMPVFGRHNAYNAAACTAVAWLIGVREIQIQRVLARFSGVEGRLQMQELSFGHLIDDSYNANLASVSAGIEVLTEMPGVPVLCLGAMAELGAKALEQHQQLARFAARKGVQALLFWYKSQDGDYAMATAFLSESEKATKRAAKPAIAETFDSHVDLSARLNDLIQDYKKTEPESKVNILIKGSRSAQMEKVVQSLKNSFQAIEKE